MLEHYVVQVTSKVGSPVLGTFWNCVQYSKVPELVKVNAVPDVSIGTNPNVAALHEFVSVSNPITM